MTANDIVHMKFEDVVWPDGFVGPATFEKDIRAEFLLDRDGKLFENHDLKDILMAYIHDEFNECPINLKFSIV